MVTPGIVKEHDYLFSLTVVDTAWVARPANVHLPAVRRKEERVLTYLIDSDIYIMTLQIQFIL